LVGKRILGNESDLNRLIVFGIHADNNFDFGDLCIVDFILEVCFSDSKLAELVLDQLLMELLILLIIFERLFYLLHLDPFIQCIDHLLFLFIDAFQNDFLFAYGLEKLFYLNIALLEDGFEFVSFFFC
jgi:hypothetical protein